MRSALLAACALVVAVPAWAQDAADATAEAKRFLTDLAEAAVIRRCEGLWPAYLAFTKDSRGELQLDLWPLHEEVSRLGTRTLVQSEGVLYIVSGSEVVELAADGAKVYQCEDAGMDLFVLLMKLIENGG